jgi:predicted small integral membrane protein
VDRRAFFAAVTGGLLVAPLGAEAQPAKVPRVGLLGLGSAESSPFFEVLLTQAYEILDRLGTRHEPTKVAQQLSALPSF